MALDLVKSQYSVTVFVYYLLFLRYLFDILAFCYTFDLSDRKMVIKLELERQLWSTHRMSGVSGFSIQKLGSQMYK